MDLSLSQLAMLIELTEREVIHLKNVIESSESTVDDVDDCGELTVQYLALSSLLAQLYKEKWSPAASLPEYEDLLKEMGG